MTINTFRSTRTTRSQTQTRKLKPYTVLCNTSANYAGCGFFPDVRSAAEWGRLERIWNAGYLYRKDDLDCPPSGFGDAEMGSVDDDHHAA
jgi:hypothetical protein